MVSVGIPAFLEPLPSETDLEPPAQLLHCSLASRYVAEQLENDTCGSATVDGWDILH